MTDPWPIAHDVMRALQHAGLDAGAERVGASNWIVSVSGNGRSGTIRIADADASMLRDDIAEQIAEAGWDDRLGLSEVVLLAPTSIPLATRIRDAVAESCARLGDNGTARLSALAALDADLSATASSADAIAVAEYAVTSAGVDAGTPLSEMATVVAERLRPFDVPLTRIIGVAWRIVIEAADPTALHRLPSGVLFAAHSGVREMVGKHLADLLISTPTASAEAVRATTWDLLSPYPLSWRTRQAEWIDHWSVSPAWRAAVADSRLAEPRHTGITDLAASTAFRAVVRALEIRHRDALAALALATFPRTGDTAWTVVSAAQAALTDPLSAPFDLSESDVRVAEPYRTNVVLLGELHAFLDDAASPALVLRDLATVEAYRDAEGAPAAAFLPS